MPSHGLSPVGTSLGGLAFCELGRYAVLVDVRHIDRVAYADAIGSEDAAIDAAELLEDPRGRSQGRRALRLSGFAKRTWLVVGDEVHLLEPSAFAPCGLPAFVSAHLRALGIRALLSHGQRLYYLLDVPGLAAALEKR